MTRWLIAIVGACSIIGLAACSDDPSVDNNPKEQVVPGDNQDAEKTPDGIQKDDSGNKSHKGKVENSDESAKMMEELNFSSFDLEINYGPNEEIDYDYEQKSDNGDYEAEIKDTVKNVIYKGAEALNVLYTQFQDLHLSADMDDEATIQEILKRFDLDSDYSKFELEMTFKDSSKLDIKDKK